MQIAPQLVAFVGVPIFLLLAWSGWARNVRPELAAWRNGLCISALLVLSLNWLGAAALEVPLLMGPRSTRPPELMESMLTLSHPVSILVIALALALRRAPRVQAVVAGVLMLISWPLGYV